MVTRIRNQSKAATIYYSTYVNFHPHVQHEINKLGRQKERTVLKLVRSFHFISWKIHLILYPTRKLNVIFKISLDVIYGVCNSSEHFPDSTSVASEHGFEFQICRHYLRRLKARH